MDIKIKRLKVKDKQYLDTIINWNYNWWGIEQGQSKAQVRYYFEHLIHNKKSLPHLYIALLNDKLVGMYCITMSDDIERPDLYPYLANGYVDKKYRGKGIYRSLMNHLDKTCKRLKIKTLYVYTKPKNLYEKFSWKFIGKEPLWFDNKIKYCNLYKKRFY